MNSSRGDDGDDEEESGESWVRKWSGWGALGFACMRVLVGLSLQDA